MYNRVQILIKGKNITSFFSEIVRLGINLYDIKKDTNKLFITIDYDDYLKILEWKTTNKITVINRYGRNKYIFLIKQSWTRTLLRSRPYITSPSPLTKETWKPIRAKVYN